MRRERKKEDIERGGRLAAARSQAGYESAADAVADMEGVEYSTYNNHETGWRGITRKTARRYAEFFQVNLDWLYENIGQPTGLGPKKPPDLLDGLPPEARTEVLNFIEFLKAKHGV